MAGIAPKARPHVDPARWALDPACAGATNRARMPCPKRRHHSPPANAKPSRQCSPSAAPSAARGRRELSRRCLSPQGELRRDPPNVVERGTGASRRCRKGVSLVTFSSPQESHSPAGARPGQSPPTEGTSKPNGKDQKPGPRPAPGDESCPDAVPLNEGTTARRQWRSRAGGGFSFCSAECSPRPAGLPSRRCLGPQGEFRRDPPTGVDRHQREPALRRNLIFGDFLVATRKSNARRGETWPITANRRQTREPNSRIKAWTGCAGATNRARMPCPNERHHSPPAMAKPSRQRNSPSAAPSATRGRRELSRRCLGPQGRVFDATRRARAERGHRREPALRQGPFFIHLSLSPQRKMVAAGRDQAITANRRHPEHRNKDQRPRTRPGAWATNRVRMPCPKRRHPQPAGNGEAEPATASPSAAPRCSPRLARCRVDV